MSIAGGFSEFDDRGDHRLSQSPSVAARPQESHLGVAPAGKVVAEADAQVPQLGHQAATDVAGLGQPSIAKDDPVLVDELLVGPESVPLGEIFGSGIGGHPEAAGKDAHQTVRQLVPAKAVAGQAVPPSLIQVPGTFCEPARQSSGGRPKTPGNRPSPIIAGAKAHDAARQVVCPAGGAGGRSGHINQ